MELVRYLESAWRTELKDRGLGSGLAATAVLALRLPVLLPFLANAALFLVGTSQHVFYPHHLDYGEGPLLDQASRIARGLSIYKDALEPPWLVANYPPLYPLLLAPFTVLFEPTFLFGRAIATLAAIASGLLVGAVVYRLQPSRFAALVATLSFLGLYPVREWSGFARTDTLGLALVLGGVLAVTHHPSRRALVIAALLLAAGGLAKQSLLLAGPAAVCLYLFVRSRRDALVFCGALAGLLVAVAFVLEVTSGGHFLFHVVTANSNTLSPDVARYFIPRLLESQSLYLCLALGVLVLLAISRRHVLAFAFAVAALGNLVTVAKVGSNVNYFLELEAALAMLLGLGLATLASRRQLAYRVIQAAFLAVLVVQAVRIYQKDHRDVLALGERLEWKQAADRILLDRIGAASGPVVGDDAMGALYLVGRPIEIQPFEYSRLAIEGHWDQRPFLEAIGEGRYSLVIFTTHMKRERYTPEMLAAVAERYRLVEVVGDSEIWAPR